LLDFEALKLSISSSRLHLGHFCVCEEEEDGAVMNLDSMITVVGALKTVKTTELRLVYVPPMPE
jgi:hypothetical protein